MLLRPAIGAVRPAACLSSSAPRQLLSCRALCSSFSSSGPGLTAAAMKPVMLRSMCSYGSATLRRVSNARAGALLPLRLFATSQPEQDGSGRTPSPPPAPTNPSGSKQKDHRKKESVVEQLAPISWASLLLLILVGGFLLFLLYEETEDTRKKKRAGVGKPQIGGSWTLVDHFGKPVSDLDYRGKFTLIYFGFTYCPDVCPVELQKMASVMRELEKMGLGGQFEALLVTIDPMRDSVGQLRGYLHEFHPALRGLTGTPEQIKKVARSFRVYSGDTGVQESEDYLVDHSIFLYFMGPDNQLVEYYGVQVPQDQLASKIAGHIKASQPSMMGSLRRVARKVIERFAEQKKS